MGRAPAGSSAGPVRFAENGRSLAAQSAGRQAAVRRSRLGHTGPSGSGLVAKLQDIFDITKYLRSCCLLCSFLDNDLNVRDSRIPTDDPVRAVPVAVSLRAAAGRRAVLCLLSSRSRRSVSIITPSGAVRGAVAERR